MKLETVEKDLPFKNLDGYINDIYNYNVGHFLGKSELSSKSNDLIKECEFNRHKNNFFSFCKQYENKIISNELSFFANKFLNIQATKEIEKNFPLNMTNKRNYTDFINTTRKFLFDNFDYLSSKYYIYFVITNICGVLSTNFEQELNLILENLMRDREIQKYIGDCFYRKFDDFQENARKFPPFNASGKIYSIPYFDSENWMNIK